MQYYDLSGKPFRIGPFRSSRTEVWDLLKGWGIIAVAFTILQTSLRAPVADLLSAFLISVVTVGTGFLLHELAHKIVAQRFGCWAEFRADMKMLVVALLTSFLGILIAAPGAVLIGGYVTKRTNGIISVAGPLTNIGLAALFLVLQVIYPSALAQFGFLINAWLAVFNMIPFGPLDGAKILAWDKRVYAGTLAAGIVLLIIGIGL